MKHSEWVLVPREPSAGMWDSAENAMIESECAYNAGKQDARSDAHGFPTMRIWQAVVGYRAMLAAAAPQPPAEPTNRDESSSKLVDGQPPAEAQPVAWCPACNGAGWAPDSRDAEQRVTCPDCAGIGSAEHSITANEAPSAPVGVEVPFGAIENGRIFADRLEAHPFESQGGDLRLCSDWQEFRRCFDYLAEWASALAQQPAACETCGGRGEVGGLTLGGYESHPCPECEEQQPAAKPDAFAVFAGEGGRVFRLSGYDGDTEAQVLGHVLARARREGFAGTAQERMAELGWWIEPMFRRSAQQHAAVDEAMVERALAAYLRRQEDGESLYGCVTAALTAALAAQDGGSDNA